MKPYRSRASLSLRLALVVVLLVAPLVGLSLYLVEQQRVAELDATRTQAMTLAKAVAVAKAARLREIRGQLEQLSQELAAPGGLRPDCGAVLARALPFLPALRDIAVADVSGEVRCAATGPLPSSANIADRDYFARAIGEPAFALSGVLRGRLSRQWTIAAAQPIVDRSGTVHGALVGVMDLRRSAELLPGAVLPAGGIVSVADAHGAIAARLPEPEKYIGRQFREAAEFARAVLTAREGFATSGGLDNTPRVVAYTAVPGSDLYVRVGLPTAHIETASARLMRTSFYAIGAGLLLALLAGSLSARQLVLQPLGRLAEAAGRLGRGDLGARTGIAHDDPLVGGLARKFDEMAAHAHKVSRALVTLSAGNQCLLREHSEDALLLAMCKVAVERGGYPLAFVNYKRDDERKSVDTVARWGRDEGFIATLRLTWEDSERGRGTVGSAIRSGEPVVFHTIAGDERFAPWRAEALKRGFRSIVSLPLAVEATVIGTFTIIAAEEDAFDADELALLREMAADLSFGIGVIRSETRRRDAEHVAQRMLTHDPVVDLPNRAEFGRALDAAIGRAAPTREPVAVLVVHIGRLREISDGFGYQPANAAVKTVAARLASLREHVPGLARVAPEDFAVVLAGADAERAATTARRLLGAFDDPVPIGEAQVHLQASVGAAFYPGHGDNADVLARRAAFAAREGFRREVPYYLYHGSTEAENSSRLALAADLRVAIDSAALTLHYQPKVDLRTGTVSGCEALVRWEHPKRGAISPVEFVRVAEETGLIRQMTYRVLDMAVRQQQAWAAAGQRLPVAINLSARNLFDPRLLEAIDGLIATWGVARDMVEFEVTESALVDDPETAKNVLRRLRELGSRIYIDDFGTGYSSLNYLVTLPLNSLKIDRSFVRMMRQSQEAYAVVSSIVSMAHSLGLRVVAEGVETAADAELLRRLDCDEAQGYFYSRPLLPEALESWCRENRGRSPN